jgi:hypothetical protein
MSDIPKLALLAAALLAVAAAAHGQTRTIYGPDGRTLARESLSRDGSSVRYGPDGRVETRTTLSRDGTATTYAPDGRVLTREAR